MNKPTRSQLLNIYTKHTAVLDEIAPLVDVEAGNIAREFYATLLDDEEARPYLTHELVEQRLSASMGTWLRDLLLPRSEIDIDAYMADQQRIGHIHARLNIPLHVVHYGLRVLRRSIITRLLTSGVPGEILTEAMLVVADLLDIVGGLINDSYLDDMVNIERDNQSLRLQALSHHLALDCERLRTELFDWLRQVLLGLYHDTEGAHLRLPRVAETDLGLWIAHKAELFFPQNPEVTTIMDKMAELDSSLETAVTARQAGNRIVTGQQVQAMNEIVTGISWLLGSLIEHTLEMEQVRDPLTRLMNRRYLPGVIQREVWMSMRHGEPFAVLLIDIDHFKQINDTFGHELGDRVLEEFSELLINGVRPSDFVFRYGGEEFLVVVSKVRAPKALAIAEKLRRAIAGHPFRSADGRQIVITASIGIAVHDGHPDYARLINAADKALYRAKQAGRNRCEAE